jgi:RNA polymerase sigma factor (sigma-70 family)
MDTHRTPVAQSGINRPSGESGLYGRERRTYTLTRAILAGSAALGHGACVTGCPVPALRDAPRCVNADMSTANTRADFEKLFLPHLDAAYNLARLLTRNAHDAEDVVQESYLRAWRAFSSFRGEASRPWLLTIVRNASFTWLRDNRSRADHTEYYEELHVSGGVTPEAESLGHERAQAVERCVQELPADFREAIVLREMEELSYQEIAQIMGVPRGTVMSRLSRARARLAECLRHSVGKEFFEPKEHQ